MTIAIWPTELPRPERDSWQMTTGEARLKRRSDSGMIAYRRRISRVPKLVTMSILVTRSGKEVFDEFFEVTTAQGSLQFWMPDPTTDQWPMVDAGGHLVLDGDGQPVLMSGTWRCLFGDTLPVETIKGIEFRKTFNIVVLP